jgi:tetratricopeptide (TPR) repeat protein
MKEDLKLRIRYREDKVSKANEENGQTIWKMGMLGLLVFVLVLAAPAQAGRGKGRLTGIVVDEKDAPVPTAKVRIEYEKGGLKEETGCNGKGEWGFIALGTGNCRVIASADGFLDSFKEVYVQQLVRNLPVKLVLQVDTEKKAKVKDEASLQELETGNQLFSERKFDEALTVYQKFAAENPDVYQIYFNIGDVFREKEAFDKALEQYNIAAAKSKEKSDVVMQAKALASCGEIFLRKSKFKEAQEYFTQSIALNPKDEILAYNVAEIFFGNNQTDNAIQYYKLAIQIKPEWSEPYVKLGYAYLNKGEIAKAVESFNEFLKRDPESAKAAVIQNLIQSLKQ